MPLKRTRICILLLFIAVILAACETGVQNEIITDDASSKQKLRIYSIDNNVNKSRLFEHISRFEEERRDVEIEFIKPSTSNNGFTWLLGKSTEHAPDLIELTSNQLRMAFHHGKLEPLTLSQSQYQDMVIASPEGDVIGLKTRINPMIAYYDKDVFLQLGIEPPSGEWDWATLDNTITVLKEADKKVYIKFSPMTLEWAAINRYGGTIVDPSGTVLTGYVHGEEAVKAAEWLLWVGTRDDVVIPSDLVEGNIALAIDFAFNLPTPSVSNFEAILRNNNRIGIAPLPGGSDAVNVAYTFGFVIPKYSENKDLAMELLRYLTKDTESYYEEILWYTLQSSADEELHDPYRISVLTQELKRSVPISVFLSEWQRSLGNGFHYDWIRRSMMEGQPVQDTLDQFALEFDTLYETFKEDLALYQQCIESFNLMCY